MLLHGEQREEQSQAVIKGHVPAAEQVHMGAIQGSAERSSRQSHKPGVPDGERHDLHIFPKQAGADCVLWQTVGAAGWDPHGAYEYHLLEEEYCGWNGKQLFTHKPPVRAILQIIQNWLVGLHKGRQDIIDFQRPDGFSGPLLSAFQLTWLIQLMDIYILVIFFRQGETRDSQALK